MTWALIMFSYFSNYIPVGAAIMLIHDLSDLPVTILKLVVDVTPRWVQYPVFIYMLASWIYLRLWVFPFHIIDNMIEECYGEKKMAGMNYSVLNMMIAFLYVLVGLHIFWCYLMLNAMIRRLRNPKSIEIVFKNSTNLIG